jgi:hypothetical protein
MARRHLWWWVALAALLALAPAVALAQGTRGASDREFTLKINGDYHVAAGDEVGTVIVIRGNATVDGTVDDALVVVDGDAVVHGRVDQGIVVVNGTLTLAAGSTVHDVDTYRSTLVRDAGATVTGRIDERSEFSLTWVPVVFGFVMWIVGTVAALAGGALFAAIGGAQLRAGARAMTERVGGSILAAAIVFIGVPVAAVLAIVTIVGAGVGVGVLLFALPAAAVLGYLAFAAMLGTVVLRTGGGAMSGHPYREVLLGVVLLQLCALIPLGGLALVVGAAWGAGGLTLVAWRAARGTRAATAA